MKEKNIEEKRREKKKKEKRVLDCIDCHLDTPTLNRVPRRKICNLRWINCYLNPAPLKCVLRKKKKKKKKSGGRGREGGWKGNMHKSPF